MLAAMTHPSRVLNLDMKAKLCMPKSYIYIYISIYIYRYIYIYTVLRPRDSTFLKQGYCKKQCNIPFAKRADV